MVGLGDISSGFNEWILLFNTIQAMLIEHLLHTKYSSNIWGCKRECDVHYGLKKFANEHILNSNTRLETLLAIDTNKEKSVLGKDKFLLMEMDEISLKKEYISLVLDINQYFHS